VASSSGIEWLAKEISFAPSLVKTMEAKKFRVKSESPNDDEHEEKRLREKNYFARPQKWSPHLRSHYSAGKSILV
jgi:hypothetical protein